MDHTTATATPLPVGAFSAPELGQSSAVADASADPKVLAIRHAFEN